MEGLDLHKIGQIVLGTETPPDTVDLKEICTNDRISKWAKWKPINYNKIGALTEEERRSVGYGLRTADTDIPICFERSIGSNSRDRENSIYAWIDNSLWLYNNGGDVIWDKPTERFRLTDFASKNMEYQFDGRERATYYMVYGNSTYSPALGYYDDALTRCISIDDLIDPTTYPDLDNLEVAILYKYNGRHYIKSSGHTIEYLKSGYNIGITPDLPTTAGMHTFEGFFVAITPESELDSKYNGWKNIFNNDDASATSVVAFRFPDSYFKGTYIVEDPSVIEGEYIFVVIEKKITMDTGLTIPLRFVGNLSDYSWNVIVSVYGKIGDRHEKIGESIYKLSGEVDEENVIQLEPDGNVTKIAIVCHYSNDDYSGSTISKLDTKTCISGDTPSTSDYYDISLFM